jgi:hypothetical protein
VTEERKKVIEEEKEPLEECIRVRVSSTTYDALLVAIDPTSSISETVRTLIIGYLQSNRADIDITE